MTALRRHRYTAALFVFLSVADLALTAHLLRHPTGEIYEANWLAGEVLACFGVVGLAAFKGLVVLLTAALVAIVSGHRPGAARRLAIFACAAVAVVVVYSAGLLLSLERQPPAVSLKDLATIEREGQGLDRRSRDRREFISLLNRAREALAAGRWSLREAVDGLAASEQGKDPAFVIKYRTVVEAKSDVECLAALAVHGALLHLAEDGSQAARSRAAALVVAFRADHGPALVPYLFTDVENLKDRGPAVAVASLSEAPRSSCFTRGKARPGFDARRPGHARSGHRASRGWPPRRPFLSGEHRFRPGVRHAVWFHPGAAQPFARPSTGTPPV